MESASTPAYVTPTASETVLAPANEPYGKIVVIKRSGQDSASFELVDAVYTFGRYVLADSGVLSDYAHLVPRIATFASSCSALPRSTARLSETNMAR